MLPLLLIPLVLLIYLLYRCCEYHPMITGGGEQLYHGSPHEVSVLKPNKPRSHDEDPFTHTEGVYFTTNKKDAMIYAVARDKDRNNKGWAVFDGKLYIKDKLEGKFNFNKEGYLYVVNKKVHKCLKSSPKYPNEYVVTCSVKPDQIITVTYDDIKDDIVYMDEDGKRELEMRMTQSKPIFLTGYAASGKSTLMKKYSKEGYYPINLDEFIRYKIAPQFADEQYPEVNFFGAIYKDDENDPVYKKAVSAFVKGIKNIIKEHNSKVVIEGQLKNHKLIREIFGNNNDFILYVIQPKNVNTWACRLASRWDEDPKRYGRLGFLGIADKAQDNIAMKDYLKNGICGKIFQDFILRIAKERFNKHKEMYESFIPEFDAKLLVN